MANKITYNVPNNLKKKKKPGSSTFRSQQKSHQQGKNLKVGESLKGQIGKRLNRVEYLGQK